MNCNTIQICVVLLVTAWMVQGMTRVDGYDETLVRVKRQATCDSPPRNHIDRNDCNDERWYSDGGDCKRFCCRRNFRDMYFTRKGDCESTCSGGSSSTCGPPPSNHFDQNDCNDQRWYYEDGDCKPFCCRRNFRNMYFKQKGDCENTCSGGSSPTCGPPPRSHFDQNDCNDRRWYSDDGGCISFCCRRSFRNMYFKQKGDCENTCSGGSLGGSSSTCGPPPSNHFDQNDCNDRRWYSDDGDCISFCCRRNFRDMYFKQKGDCENTCSGGSSSTCGPPPRSHFDQNDCNDRRWYSDDGDCKSFCCKRNFRDMYFNSRQNCENSC